MAANTVKNILPPGAARDYYALPPREAALEVAETPATGYGASTRTFASDEEADAAAKRVMTKYRGALERLAKL